MSAERYPYSPAYQQQVLALMLQDPQFLRKFSGAINPHYFSNDDYVTIVGLVLKYFETHHEPPTRDLLDAEVITFCRTAGTAQETLGRIRSIVDESCRIQLENSAALSETITKWARNQEVASAVEKSIGILNSGDPDQIEGLPDLFRQAISAGYSTDLGVEFFSMAERLSDLAGTVPLLDRNKRVPFPLPTLTERLHGGTGPGEICIILGETKKGKSIWLANVAAFAACFAHKNVVYITNELKAPQVLLRIATRVTGITEDDILSGDPRYLTTVRQFLGAQNQLWIHYYSPDTATVGHVRNYLAQLQLIRGIKPDLLIVDDADNVKLAGYETDSHQKLGKIYKQLIEVGDEFECPVHTASQFNRSGYDDDEADVDAIQGSLQKAQQASLALALIQNKEEEKQGYCRIVNLRSRRGADRYTVRCIFDKSLMRISEYTPPPPPPESSNGDGGKSVPPPPPPPAVSVSKS